MSRSFATPRSMQTIRYRQPSNKPRSLDERPGLQRFRSLPEPVARVVLDFLEEVRLSTPEYSLAYSRAWRDFLQRFSLIFFEPFQATRHFARKEELSDHELMTYSVNLIAALRPVLLGLRDTVQPAEQPGRLGLIVNAVEEPNLMVPDNGQAQVQS